MVVIIFHGAGGLLRIGGMRKGRQSTGTLLIVESFQQGLRRYIAKISKNPHGVAVLHGGGFFFDFPAFIWYNSPREEE